jgi:glycosyltransferase involved in cell wall biosynthesis
MLTVLLATRNRAHILSDVLECFCQLQPPAFGWKLVIADNGSTDNTQRVLESFVGRLALQHVFEPKLGKNYALNAALPLIEGDLTVLTDDDVFPRPDWLVQLRKAADQHPGYSIFGGAIVPRWSASPPPWTQWIDLGPVFTITRPDLQEGEFPLSEFSTVQGPNMAIRSSIFYSGVRFDPSIGPSGSDYPMGSETELLFRLGRARHKAWCVPGAVVEHLVREEQLREDWVLQRAMRWGRGRYRMSQNPKLWFGVPRHLFRDIPKEAALLVLAWLSRKRDALFRARWRFNVLRGMATEARQLAREKTAQLTSG